MCYHNKGNIRPLYKNKSLNIDGGINQEKASVFPFLLKNKNYIINTPSEGLVFLLPLPSSKYLSRGAQYLAGDNLQVVWTKFSTLS